MTERTGSTALAAKAAAARALMADEQDHDARFEEALELDARDPRPLVAARVRLLWGERLHRARRRGDARTQLRAARAVFEDLGATAWVDRADTALRAAGEAGARRQHNELSPQERAVAEKAARGMTVKQIGAELYLSGKTVEGHLSAVYRKLGITGRIALADAIRSGLP